MSINKLTNKSIKWNTAIYVRISEEERVKSYSASIANQKSILTSYALDNGLNIIEVYADDGFKGGNFNRPFFKRMIADIDIGLINCVLVKDLSRFGREHIEGDYYLERYFPSKGIRFISLHESLDSVKDPVRMNSIEIPLINIFNEQYLRQVSNATKASLKIKRKEGKFVGAKVPYGYMRSNEDKYKLITDFEVKHNVENIFKWFLSCENFSRIVNKLNAMDVLSPTDYRKKLNKKPIKIVGHWSIGHVKAILNQPIYTGDMVQGRTYSYNHKAGIRLPLPKEQWTIVKDTHEAIISKIDYENVQSLINSSVKPSTSKNKLKPSILSGFLVCSECGKKMIRSTSSYDEKVYHKFICSTYKKYGAKACSSHLIREDVMLDIALCTLNTIIMSVLDIEKALISAQDAEMKKKIAIMQKHYQNVKESLNNIIQLKMGLYSDYKLNVISLDEYRDMKEDFEKQYTTKKQQLSSQEKQILELKSSNWLENESFNRYRQYYDGIKQLDRKIIVSLIDTIIVDDDRNIKIRFKFQDEIKKYKSIFDK